MNTIIISKQNLLYNLKIVKDLAQNKASAICAVVKANAYGHGLKEIVTILDDKVNFFAVANIEEAVELRKYTQNKVLILGKTEDITRAVENSISISVVSQQHLNEIIKNMKNINATLNIHLKVNCGMNRLGEKEISVIKGMLTTIKKNSQIVNLEGIYTHFPNLTNDEDFKKQYEFFNSITKFVKRKYNPVVHMGGSLVLTKNIKCDMVRVGIYLYGYKNDLLKPVMKIESQVIKIIDVAKNEKIGYGDTYIAKQNIKVAVLPIGYYDGIKRNMTASYVYCNGKKCKIVGNVCMDMLMIKVSSTVKLNDKVLIFNDAVEWSEKQQTNIHEVLTNFSTCRAKIIVE